MLKRLDCLELAGQNTREMGDSVPSVKFKGKQAEVSTVVFHKSLNVPLGRYCLVPLGTLGWERIIWED